MEYIQPRVIKLDIPDAVEEPGFDSARKLAEDRAQDECGEVMLVSWKDNVTGKRSPDVESCTCGMEGWEQYALSRGAELRVEAGKDYIFYFKIL